MPVFPEEPEIHKSLPGPGVPVPRESDAQALRTPVAGSPAAAASTTVTAAPATVPGPRPAPPRPAPPRADRSGPPPRPATIPKPGPAPRRPAAPQVPVQQVPATAADALDRADEAVDLLLDSGRDPGDILVLTVGEEHPWAQHELSFGEERYWAQLAEGGDVFYADAFFADGGANRAARRDVVVLVVNDGGAAGRAGSGGAAGLAERAAQAYGKALAHAASLLVVCGDAGPAAALAAGASTAR